MGAKSRRKGCRGELEARRGRQYQGGDDSPDVCTAIPGVHVEVKRQESFRLYPALEQAVADAGENVPIVLHRTNCHSWVVILRLADLPRLAVQLYLTLAQNPGGNDHADA